MLSATQVKWSSGKLRLTTQRTMPGNVKRVGAEAFMGKPSKAPEPNWLQVGLCILCLLVDAYLWMRVLHIHHPLRANGYVII